MVTIKEVMALYAMGYIVPVSGGEIASIEKESAADGK